MHKILCPPLLSCNTIFISSELWGADGCKHEGLTWKLLAMIAFHGAGTFFSFQWPLQLKDPLPNSPPAGVISNIMFPLLLCCCLWGLHTEPVGGLGWVLFFFFFKCILFWSGSVLPLQTDVELYQPCQPSCALCDLCYDWFMLCYHPEPIPGETKHW